MSRDADVVLFLLAFVGWALIHSLTASLGFKALSRSLIGAPLHEGFYRLFYNLFSLATFTPVLLAAAALLPETVVWSVDSPLRWAFFATQLASLLCLAVSVWQTGLWRFAGLRQVVAYLNRDLQTGRQPALETGGLYRLVRHPLYLFSLTFLWFTPTMTWQTLIFNLCATLYFWAGSIFEERKLVAQFGDEYRSYRRRVPRLIPFTNRL